MRCMCICVRVSVWVRWCEECMCEVCVVCMIHVFMCVVVCVCIIR